MAKVNETCIGCGACTAVAPDVFEMNDEGQAYVISEDAAAANPEGVQEAADSCPVEAIEA